MSLEFLVQTQISPKTLGEIKKGPQALLQLETLPENSDQIAKILIVSVYFG